MGRIAIDWERNKTIENARRAKRETAIMHSIKYWTVLHSIIKKED